MIGAREEGKQHALVDGIRIAKRFISGANNRPNAMKRPVTGDRLASTGDPHAFLENGKLPRAQPRISCPGSRTDVARATAFAFVAPGIRTLLRSFQASNFPRPCTQVNVVFSASRFERAGDAGKSIASKKESPIEGEIRGTIRLLEGSFRILSKLKQL